MEVSRIKQWISKGEGHHLEFKLERESNEDFAKVVIAFANTDGGKILVGVDDSGEMIGVSDVDLNATESEFIVTIPRKTI